VKRNRFATIAATIDGAEIAAKNIFGVETDKVPKAVLIESAGPLSQMVMLRPRTLTTEYFGETKK
jgi:hypothetical protein